MELILQRTYDPKGTNGELRINGETIAYTIELPWLENRRNVSCIPEGSYRLVKRYTDSRGWHIYIPDVPGRSWILFHPANDALTELEGCIAPVSELNGPGKGLGSRKAMDKVENRVFAALDQDENVLLIIKKKSVMNVLERAKSPTPKFFKVLRTIGLILAAAGGAVMAAPVSLPAGIAAIGGYLTVGGGILTAVSQVTVEDQTTQSSTDDG